MARLPGPCWALGALALLSACTRKPRQPPTPPPAGAPPAHATSPVATPSIDAQMAVMSWLTVQGGVREGTGVGSPNAWPYQVMDALLGEYGVGTTSVTDDRQEIPRDERVVRGHVGTDQAGYRWLEGTSLETSAIPVRVELAAYGLAGLDLEWKFALEQDGQYGFTAVRQRSLRVRFQTPEAAARFERAWTQAGGGPHQLAPE